MVELFGTHEALHWIGPVCRESYRWFKHAMKGELGKNNASTNGTAGPVLINTPLPPG